MKLTNTQLNKGESWVKHKTGTMLRLNKKNFEDDELPDELFQTTRQTTKLRNGFSNKISTDIRFNKAHISKKIQSGEFVDKNVCRISEKVLLDLAAPLAKDIFLKLASKAISPISNKFTKR